jgi:nucleotidyltransferase/DNA polymerase involved in DNA repair
MPSSESRHPRHERVILHVDMDAFYAAVEVREDPTLAGKPLIIGHRGPRGVVSTCSYEARRFGVRSAMPSVRAERLCPQATWLPGRMSLYADVSRQIRALFDSFTPLVEPLSIDEAFLDLTGIAPDLDHGRTIAAQLKEAIRAQQHLTASVGIAPNKFLAKVASDLRKPDGLVVIGHNDIASVLWPLPIERLWGVGPKTAERLKKHRLHTIGSLLQVTPRTLAGIVGARHAEHLQHLARGEDRRAVEADRDARSISEERTYGTDLIDPDAIDRAILERAEGVSLSLRQQALRGRTVHLKVRAGDFTTWTRAKTLPVPTHLADVIAATARQLFRTRIDLGGQGVRLLGVGVSGLEAAEATQPSLFPVDGDARARRLAHAADSVRAKLGSGVLVRARLLRTKRDADEPDEPGDEASSLPSVD